MPPRSKSYVYDQRTDSGVSYHSSDFCFPQERSPAIHGDGGKSRRQPAAQHVVDYEGRPSAPRCKYANVENEERRKALREDRGHTSREDRGHTSRNTWAYERRRTGLQQRSPTETTGLQQRSPTKTLAHANCTPFFSPKHLDFVTEKNSFFCHLKNTVFQTLAKNAFFISSAHFVLFLGGSNNHSLVQNQRVCRSFSPKKILLANLKNTNFWIVWKTIRDGRCSHIR